MSGLLIPSYAQGFARCAAESEYPGLWRGLITLHAPQLGPTGWDIHDWGPGRRHAEIQHITGHTEPPGTPGNSWVLDGGHAIDWHGILRRRAFFGDDVLVTESGPWTFAGCVVVNSWANSTFAVLVSNGILSLEQNSGTPAVAYRRKYWYRPQANIPSFALGEPNHLGVTYNGNGHLTSTNYHAYHNGCDLTHYTGASNEVVNATNWIGYYGQEGDGPTYWAGIWGRELTPAEFQLLHEDRFAMFRLRRRVFAETEGGGGATAEPDPVSASWSVVSPRLQESRSASPTSATWSATSPGLEKTINPGVASVTWSPATPATAKSVRPAPASCTWTVVSPGLPRTVQPSPATAVWTVPPPATGKVATATPAAASWSAITPATKRTATPAATPVTWSALAPTLSKRIGVSPVEATWAIPTPTTSTATRPTPPGAVWSIASPTVGKRITLSPVAAQWSVPPVGAVDTVSASPVGTVWAVATPTLRKRLALSAASVTWSLGTPTLNKRIAPSPLFASWAAAIPTTTTPGRHVPPGLFQSGHYHLGA